VIILMVMVLNILNSVGMDGSIGNQDSDRSVLSTIGKTITPLFTPMGIDEDNWPATVGIFTGVLAKEAVVGTLDALYAQLASEDAGAPAEQQPFEFWTTIGEAAATIPTNLAAVKDTILDPLSLDVGDISNTEAAAESQEVNTGTFGAMAARYDGQAGAFAYLLFILLYYPCVATMGAIARETGRAWAGFVAFWTTSMAYTIATVFYQTARFEQHPTSSSAWIIGLIMLMTGVIIGLRYWGKREEATPLAYVKQP
jgi:ferrous iron transport protein B